MLNIRIETIKDEEQRYDTVGDYYMTPEGQRVFKISDMGNWRYELLVAVHELVESALCKAHNVSDEAIDSFDFAYENNRKEGDRISEPGDDPHAPYYKEHQFATGVEKMLAEQLEVDWEDYAKTCQDLTQN